MTTTILLVRHGRTAWNKEERFRGLTDLPLDEEGLRQAELVGQYIARQRPVAAIYASPLQRTLQTAQPLARLLGIAAQPNIGLRDLDYGDFAGLAPSEAEARFPALYGMWVTAPHLVSFPRGESLWHVQARSMDLIGQIVQQHADQTVALVTHLAVCRVILCSLLDLHLSHFWRFNVEPGSVTAFQYRDGIFTMLAANDTGHLNRTPWAGAS